MNTSEHYDVVVIGGAVAGSAFATLLRRARPATRVLVIERRARFDRKVGEATVEVSGLFLHRALGLYDHLSRYQLPKHGLRFWFTDSKDRGLEEMSEVGPTRASRLPSFQLDRSRLDESLVELAATEGCEVARPARVLRVALGWPESRVTFSVAGGRREVTARWVIDATGRRAFLGRQLDLIRRNEEHPTSAVWCRWRGAADLDGVGVMGSSARRSRLHPIAASRRLATNHFCGYGWWCWAIPLAGGETSVGLVYNRELFQLDGEGGLADRYRAFVTAQAGLRELLAGAVMEEGDCRGVSHLPYCAERYAGKGWALVGDAASFIDPYYSPGLDHVAISTWATERLVEEDLDGRLDEALLTARLEEHNDLFQRSYRRWFEGLYKGKYEILGDAELTASAFLFDTAMYYLGVVSPVYGDVENLSNPVLGLRLRSAEIASVLLAAFNRRMNRLARFRSRVGRYGRRNAGWRLGIKSPDLGLRALPMLWQGLRLWLRAEGEFLLYRVSHRRLDLDEPVPPAPSETGKAGAPAPAL
jgi:flavin-dependent dehydrogenase